MIQNLNESASSIEEQPLYQETLTTKTTINMNHILLKTAAVITMFNPILKAENDVDVKVLDDGKVKIQRIELNADDLKLGEPLDLLKLIDQSKLNEEEKKCLEEAVKMLKMDAFLDGAQTIDQKVKVLAGGNNVKIQRIVIDADALAGKGMVDLTPQVDDKNLSEEERAELQKVMPQIKAQVVTPDVEPAAKSSKKLNMSQKQFIEMAEEVNGKPLTEAQLNDVKALWMKNKK